jgi:hypothetical protein
VQSVKIVVLASMAMIAKNAKQANIACLPRTIQRPVSNVVLGDTNRILAKQAAFHVHQESINILKGKRHAQIVRWDVRRTLSVTIKVNVCCVPLVKKLHDLVVQSVKIVVLASMVMVVKHAKLDSIARLLWTAPRPVPHAIVDGINLVLGKQAVSRVRQESIATRKGFQNVLIV